MPNLGLVKMGDDPSKTFIPLQVGQYLGRTPVELLSSQEATAPNDKINNNNNNNNNPDKPIKKKNKKKKRNPPSLAELAKLQQKYAPVNIVEHDGKRNISRECLQVTRLSSESITLVRHQPNVPDKAPFQVQTVVAMSSSNSRSISHQDTSMKNNIIVPNQSFELHLHDVLQIHKPPNATGFQYSFQVVEEPPCWRVQQQQQAKKKKTKQQHYHQSETTTVKDPQEEMQETEPVILPPSFWNPSWGGLENQKEEQNENEADSLPLPTNTPEHPSTVNEDATTATTASTFWSLSSLSLRDMNLSTGQLFWKQLNGSMPNMGATLLHMTLPQQLPSPKLCQDLLKLLTWGPHTTEHAHGTRPAFFWDGPRLYHAMIWMETLLVKGRHSTVLLPRLNEAAPDEWWKTILDDIFANQEDNDNDDAMQPSLSVMKSKKRKNAMPLLDENDEFLVIDKKKKMKTKHQGANQGDPQHFLDRLRMQSCSLQALVTLLQSSLDYEQCGQHQVTSTTSKESGSDSDSDNTADGNDDSSDDDDDELVGAKRSTQENTKISLKLLQELRSYGTKATLQVIASVLSKVWMDQREYLLPTLAAGSIPLHEVVMFEARCDVAHAMVSQLARLFGIACKILENDPSHPPSPKKRSRRRRAQYARHGLSQEERQQILWNAMAMQVQTHFSVRGKSTENTPSKKNENNKITDQDALLLGWVHGLQDSLGKEFAGALAEHAKVAEHYLCLSGM
jgi:hypothetical protein